MRILITLALIASLFYLADGARDFMSATKHMRVAQIEAALQQ